MEWYWMVLLVLGGVLLGVVGVYLFFAYYWYKNNPF